MRTTIVTADMINRTLFNKFDSVEVGSDYTNMDVANCQSYTALLEAEGEQVEVVIHVFTKYINDNDANELIDQGHDDARYIYNQISWISEKWEVVPRFGESDLAIVVTEAAQAKLDEIHEEWESMNKDYVIDRIEKLISHYN